MVQEGREVYIVNSDNTYSATKVEILGEGNPGWSDDERVWEGMVCQDGNHYRKGEVIFGRESEIYESKDEVEELVDDISEKLVYNSEN